MEISDEGLKKRLDAALVSGGYSLVAGQADAVISDSSDIAAGTPSLINRGAYLIAVCDEMWEPERLSEFDDFVMKPFHEGEVLVRLRVASAKGKLAGVSTVFETAGLVMDFDNYEISADGKPLNLTFKEFELLKTLMENSGRVLTRKQLLESVWEYEYIGGTRTVDVHIRRLRSKLGRYGELIETIRNVGYRFRKTRG